jgi:hypothetical protein
MFRIRRVYDDVTPTNKEAIAQVQKILHEQFRALSKREIAKLQFVKFACYFSRSH